MLEFILALALMIPTPPGLQTETGTVTGIVRTSQGTPVADARVAVAPVDGADAGSVLQGLARTDRDGRYRIENIPPGRYHIMTGPIGSPLYLPGVNEIERAATIAVSGRATTSAPDFVFTRSKVTGRVIDAVTGLGRQVDSLSICCDYSMQNSTNANKLSAFGLFTIISWSAITAHVNEDGTFEFPAVPSGNHYIQTSSFAQPITVTDADLTGLEVQVSTETDIRGNVVDHLGRPVTAVSLSLKPQASNSVFEVPAGYSNVRIYGSTGSPDISKPSPTDIRNRLMTYAKPRIIPIGPEGSFKFPAVLPGSYLLEINTPGGNSTQQEIKAGANEADIRIEIPFTQIAGRVVVDGGGALPLPTGSVRIFGTASDARVLYCIPDADGRFFQLLEPGEYRVLADYVVPNRSVLSISDGSRDLVSQPFVFDGVHPPEIRITVERQDTKQ